MQALVQCPVIAAGRLDNDKLDTGLPQHLAQAAAPAGVIPARSSLTRRCDVDVEMGLADIDTGDHLFLIAILCFPVHVSRLTGCVPILLFLPIIRGLAPPHPFRTSGT